MKSSKSVFHNGNELTPFISFSISRKNIKKFDLMPSYNKRRALVWYDEQIAKLKQFRDELERSI